MLVARMNAGGEPVPFELPPRPRLKGRAGELTTLESALARGETTRLALVGGGGSGKSVLAAALAHRMRARYPGGAAWLRVGNWDHRTLLQMLALHLRAPREPLPDSVRDALAAGGPRLVVLDNHENDRALARFLDALAGAPVTWIITARRCLLSGVAIFPVVAPLVHARRAAFPRVAALTRLLRWNPLALDIADALVGDGALSVEELRAWLVLQGVTRVRVMAHEDDVVEVRLLCEWAWPRLPAAARRMLAVLAHCPGDHMDGQSLATLARAPAGPEAARALEWLRRWRLVQEPTSGRFALHAVVRYALADRTAVPPERYFRHYVRLLEREPARVAAELTHLFAAMDHAQASSSIAKILKVESLLSP
ncbi:MAG TPA: hypothetical protein VFH68_01020 [Polyangia bacterium]|jgi:hypothetical protein|nr:hypothetical protein [Polyangia bacterium]